MKKRTLAQSIEAITGPRPTFPGLRLPPPKSTGTLTFKRRDVIYDLDASINPVTVANRHTSLLTVEEIQQLIKPLEQARDRAQEGTMNFDHWVILSSALNVTKAIQDGGVVRISGLDLNVIEQALEAIGQRGSAQQWKGVQPSLEELFEVNGLTLAHAVQLRQLTYGEYTEAHRLAQSRVLSRGGQVLVVQPD